MPPWLEPLLIIPVFSPKDLWVYPLFCLIAFLSIRPPQTPTRAPFAAPASTSF